MGRGMTERPNGRVSERLTERGSTGPEALAPGARFRLAGLVTGVPAVVWLLTAAHLFLLLSWSILVPVYRAPDEPNHVDMVRAAASPTGWPDPGGREVNRQVHASLVAAGFSDPDRPSERLVAPLQTEDAVPRSQRPGFDELAPDQPSAERNQLAQHPPLHYLVTTVPVLAVTALLPLSWAHDQTVWLMRLVSVVLVAPVPLLAFAATRRLTGRGGPVAIAAAVLPLTVPQLTHIGSAVNNDNLLVALVGLLTVVLLYVATGDTSRRTAVWVGVLGAGALLTKGFALFLPVWIGAAYLVAAARRRAWRHTLVSCVAALAVAGAGGAWWWLRNLVRYGTLQPSIIEPTAASVAADPWTFLSTLTSRMAQRYWAAFGWDELHLSWWVVWTAVAVVTIGIGLAFALRPRTAPWWRADVGVALVPVVCIVGIVTYGAWDWYATTGTFAGMQGRYLFPGVVGTAAVVALGYGALLRGAGRGLPLALFAGATAMQAAAGVVALVYFWGPGVSRHPRIALAALLAWAPWPPVVLAAILVGLAASGAGCLALLVRAARRPVPVGPPAADQTQPAVESRA